MTPSQCSPCPPPAEPKPSRRHSQCLSPPQLASGSPRSAFLPGILLRRDRLLPAHGQGPGSGPGRRQEAVDSRRAGLGRVSLGRHRRADLHRRHLVQQRFLRPMRTRQRQQPRMVRPLPHPAPCRSRPTVWHRLAGIRTACSGARCRKSSSPPSKPSKPPRYRWHLGCIRLKMPTRHRCWQGRAHLQGRFLRLPRCHRPDQGLLRPHNPRLNAQRRVGCSEDWRCALPAHDGASLAAPALFPERGRAEGARDTGKAASRRTCNHHKSKDVIACRALA